MHKDALSVWKSQRAGKSHYTIIMYIQIKNGIVKINMYLCKPYMLNVFTIYQIPNPPAFCVRPYHKRSLFVTISCYVYETKMYIDDLCH